MDYLGFLVPIIVSSIVSLFLAVTLQRPLESRWERIASRLGASLPAKLGWVGRQCVQMPVISVGLFGLFITLILQIVPLVMAYNGGLAHYSFYAAAITLTIWQMIVYGLFRVSMKLVRFRYHTRATPTIDQLEYVPATIWKARLLGLLSRKQA